MTNLLDAALQYARNGYPVFPVGGGKDGKAPLTLHGFHDATRDERLITEWWKKWPKAGIGVPTGAVTDLVVLDEDPRHAGTESFESLIQQHGELPETPVARTGGGGRHFWFSHPGGEMANVVGFRPGLDIRADGGYVVVPPSPHKSGAEYEWIATPFDVKKRLIPGWLFKIATEHSPEAYEGLPTPVNIPPPAADEEVLNRVFTGPNGALHKFVYERHLSKVHTKDHPAYVTFCTALFLAGAEEEQVPRILHFEPDSWVKSGRAQWRHLVSKGGYYRRHNTIVRVSSLYGEAEIALKAAADEEAAKRDAAERRNDRPAPPLTAGPEPKSFEGFFDKRGIPIQNAFVESIMSDRHFATFADDFNNCLLYNDGLYDGNADAYIIGVVEGIHKARGSSSSNHFRDEVRKAIRARTLIDRGLFNPPGYVLVANGVLDITDPKDPKLIPPAPVAVEGEKVSGGPPFTARVPISYDAGASCPTFDRVLAEWLPDQASQDLLLEWFGYCLVPGNPFQVALMLMGPGKNGKSTALAVLRDILGPKSVSAETLQDLSGGKFSAAELWGKLANICPDVPATVIRDTGKFKALLGGDLVSAQRKYGQPFTFINTAKAVFAANQMPDVDDETVAFWRRWLLVRFDYFVPEEKRIENLVTLLKDEHPGILNLAIRGLARLRERGGFDKSGTVENAMQEWRRRSNSLRWFVEEQCEAGAEYTVIKADFYAAYTQFCDDKGVQAKEPNRVGNELPQMVPGVKPVVRRHKEPGAKGKGQSTRFWVGIRVREDPDDGDGGPGPSSDTGATGATGGLLLATPAGATRAGTRVPARALDGFGVAPVAPASTGADAVSDPEDLFGGQATRADRARAAIGPEVTSDFAISGPPPSSTQGEPKKRHTDCEYCMATENHVCYGCPRCNKQENRYDDPAETG